MSELDDPEWVGNQTGVVAVKAAPNPSDGSLIPLISAAIEKGISPADMKEMFELQQRWEQAQAQKAFGLALASFQAEMPQVQKTKTTKGGKFNFTYASLDDVMKAATPILAKHGISLAFDSQHTTSDKQNLINVTLRIRVGAYSEDRKFGCPVPTDLNASQPQQWGAALSYAKRYALCAALNIVVTDEDTDAAGLVDTISGTQLVELEVLIQEAKADLDRLLAWQEVESLDLLPRAKFAAVKDMLVRKKTAK